MSERDLIDVVEAAYDLRADEASWLAQINAAAARAYRAPLGAFTYAYALAGDRVVPGATAIDAEVDAASLLQEMHASAPPEAVHHFYRHGPLCGVFADTVSLAGVRPELFAPAVDRWRAVYGVGDLFTLNLRGRARRVHVTIPHATPRERTDPVTLRRWSRITAHLAAGLRLRELADELPEAPAPEAILGPDGADHHAEGAAREASARDSLRREVRRRERARGSLSVRDPDRAVAIWRGMVDGRWSLVDRWESDGRRYVLALRNEPTAPDPRALTAREKQVASLLARGASTKHVAYELGLAPGTVGDCVKGLARKLGVRSRAQLVAQLRAFAPEASKK